MKLAPFSKLDDGKMDILISKHQSVWTLVRFFLKVFSGTHVGAKGLDYTYAKESFKVNILPDNINCNPITVDGEVMGNAPFAVEILPAAFEVFI